MGYFQMSRNIEEIFGGVVVAPHQIPFTYTSTNGGETFLSLPFYPITGFVTINGGVQVPLDNFEINGNTLYLGRELEPSDVVFCLFDKIMSPQDASNNAIRIYKFLSVGGETEFTPDFTAYGVQSLFIDGRYKVPGEDYNYFKTSNKVVLDNALATGVWVVAEMNIKQNIPALAGNDGASQVGTSDGKTVQEHIDNLMSQDYQYSGITMALFPRLMAKLSAYRHGNPSYQTEFRLWGFGSSVGNGATIGGNSSPYTPIAKFFEYMNSTINRTNLYPFTKSNKSVDGSSINDFLTRDWDAATSGGLYPDLALFVYGMNDFPTALYNAGATFGENGFKERLRKAIRTVKSAGGDVVLTTTPHPHMGRYNWSMPSAVSQVWPSPSPAPVSDDNIIPSAANSAIDIVWKGKSIRVAHRFLRGNDAIRQVGVEEGCVVIDIEKFDFDARATVGEDAMFDLGQTVHPNYKGHELTYQRGIKALFNGMDQNAIILPAPAKLPTITVGGSALYPQPGTADVDLMAIGQRSLAYAKRDQFARVIEQIDQNGLLTKTSYTSQSPTTSSPGYSLQWLEYFSRTKGLYAANDTLIIEIPNRTSKKIMIDAWTSAQTSWAQFMELLVTNREGVVTYTVIGNHDQTPPAGGGSGSPTTGGSRLFTITISGGSLVITALVDLTSLKYRIIGFGI